MSQNTEKRLVVLGTMLPNRWRIRKLITNLTKQTGVELIALSLKSSKVSWISIGKVCHYRKFWQNTEKRVVVLRTTLPKRWRIQKNTTNLTEETDVELIATSCRKLKGIIDQKGCSLHKTGDTENELWYKNKLSNNGGTDTFAWN